MAIEVGGNLVREWRGGGLPLSAGMGCAVAFTCPCGRPKIYGDRFMPHQPKIDAKGQPNGLLGSKLGEY